MSNPYSGLPDHQFWRRSVARIEPFNLDPVIATKFQIAPSDRVATAGSCFAQHISRRLTGAGFNYWITEPGERSRNFGVFSCRYGNIYTSRQLRQLIDEAFGTPRHIAWARDDGRFVDGLRPQVEPAGYDSPEAVAVDRERHLARVREMFERLDVLVFTFGLTECWLARSDGTAFPLAPGVAAGDYDPAQHEFVNLTVSEVVEDMEHVIRSLRSANPRSRILLTVSPVPLIATYEPRHVLVSTTYSKSVLRVAAQQLAESIELVDYFPSYEIVTGNHSQGRYFEDDLREVNDLGVDHAMRCFMRHYATTAVEQPVKLHPSGAIRIRVTDNSGIVCDEEAIEAARKG